MAKQNTQNYVALSAELDEILSRLEMAEGDIDEAMALYQKGMTIIKQLETYLKTAENKVKKIQADFAKPKP